MKAEKCQDGKTWPPELFDKVEPVAIHYHWAIRRCGGDTTLLRQHLKNIVIMQTNILVVTNYEPSRQLVFHPNAQTLLETAAVSQPGV